LFIRRKSSLVIRPSAKAAVRRGEFVDDVDGLTAAELPFGF
jgi:hypothetical protein